MRCNHVEEPAKEIITLNGRTVIVQARRCIKCDEVFATPEQIEYARKELNPSLFHRFKEFVGHGDLTEATASIFKGRLL